jgi:hypothetical protein
VCYLSYLSRPPAAKAFEGGHPHASSSGRAQARV